MSLMPHPEGSYYCDAEASYTVVPFVEGRRCESLAYQRTVFCDKPSNHVRSKNPTGRRHMDHSTCHMWWDDAEAETESEVVA